MKITIDDGLMPIAIIAVGVILCNKTIRKKVIRTINSAINIVPIDKIISRCR